MKFFGRNLGGIPKMLVVLAVTLLVASGLCGITTSIEERHHWWWFGAGLPDTLLGNTLKVVDLASWAAFMISALGIVVLVVLWPIMALLQWRERRISGAGNVTLGLGEEKSDRDQPS